MKFKNQQKVLSLFLWLVAIHSILVGIGLIVFPSSLLSQFGLPDHKNNFFQAQGGTFHIAVSIAYCMAAWSPKKSINIIWFIILLKLTAFIFLVIYYIFGLQNWLIFLSAVGDGAMSLILYFLLRNSDFEKSI